MHKKTANQLHHSFLAKECSCVEIVENHLGRIDAHNPRLNAFLAVYHDRALKKARALDEKNNRGEKLGKLAGVAIAIKDNILLQGEITTCGSKFLENYRAPYNATVCDLLEEEDAIIIGKTNMDEFAMGGSGTHSAFSPTKNPWNLACTPGGSSSGSAAAVSGLLCPIALGSDTGGSIRQPAAFTGITGFKPTYGRVSRFGLIAFASSLDQIGPLTRNVEDAALVMEVIAKHCPKDSTSINSGPIDYLAQIEKPVKGAKIGIPWSFLDKLHGEPLENFEKSLEVYKDLGCSLVEIDLDSFKYGIAIYYVIATAEASTNLARFDGIRYGNRSKNAKTLDEVYDLSREEGFGSEVKSRIMLGTFVLSGDAKSSIHQKASQVRTLIIRQAREAFGKCDIIALPTTPNTAFQLNAMNDPLDEYLQDLYTVGANIAGLPGISIPSGFSKANMPFSIQLLGPQMHDSQVLRFAQAFQKSTGFANAFAPVFGETI